MLNSFTTPGADGVEPGITTTEFWVAAATEAMVFLDVFQIHHFTQQQDALIIAAVPMVYILARTLIKAVAHLRPSAVILAPAPAPAPVLPVAPVAPVVPVAAMSAGVSV